jgi:tape measure domain-containing protein
MSATQQISIRVSMSGQDQAKQGFKDIGTEAENAGNKIAASAQKSSGYVTALKALLAGFTFEALTSAADQFTNLTNRTAIFARTASEAKDGLKGVYDIAIETRQPVSAIGELYQRMSLALSGTGKSSEYLLGITQNLAKALVVGGSSAVEAQGALRQLSQAISFGTLRGQEYNSVAKEFPILLKLIGQELGVPTTALKALAAQGKITTDVILRAANSTDYISALFGKVVITFGGAFTQLSTALGETVGRLNQITGIGSAVSGVISGIAIYIHNLVNDKDRLTAFWENFKLGVIGVALFAIPSLVIGIQSTITALTELAAVQAVVDALALPWVAVGAAILAVVAILYRFRNVEFGKNHVALVDVMTASWRALQPVLETVVDVFNKVKDTLVAVYDKIVDIIDKSPALQLALKALALLSPAVLVAKGIGLAGSAVGDFAKTAADERRKNEKADADASALKEANDRTEAERMRAQEEAAYKASQALVELTGKQLAALKAFQNLNKEFDSGQEIGLNYAEGLQVVANYIKLFPERTSEAERAVKGLTDVMVLQQLTIDQTPKYLRGLRDGYDGMLASIDPVTAAQTKLTAQNKELNASVELLGKSKEETARISEHLTQTVLLEAKASADALVSGYAPTLAILDETDKKIADIQARAGKGQGQIAPELADKAAAYEKKQGALKATAADVGPDVTGVDAISKGFKAALAQMQLDLGTFGGQVKNGFGDIFKGLTDGLTNWATGSKTAIKDMEKTLVSAVATMVIKLLTLYAIQKLTGSVSGGGSGSVGNVLVGALTGSKASGGDVIAGKSYWVGEEGPERFVPGRSGTIIPAQGGGATNHVTINVSTPDADSFQRSQGQILAKAHRTLARSNGRNN